MVIVQSGYTASVRLPFELRHRIGLAALVAFLTYCMWAVIGATSAAVGLAAFLGDRASRTVLESPLNRFIGGWQLVVLFAAIALVVMVIGRTRFMIAGATSWFLGLLSLSIMAALLWGFFWPVIPILAFAFLTSVYAAIAARAA